MLTHDNLVSNALTGCEVLGLEGSFTALSFLPLSHSFERLVDYCFFYKGITIAYAESVQTVAANLVEVKPHVFVAVPRVYEKVMARVLENATGRRRSQGEDLPLGDRRRARSAAEAPDLRARGPQGEDRRQAGLLEDPRAPGRPVRLRDVGRRAARPRRRRVLLGRRDSDLRGLRPDRDLAGDLGERARRHPARHGRPADAAHRSEDRRRRRDPLARARTRCGATSASPRRPPKRSTPRAGSTPATSAISTTAASSSSPTARRS